ncbi:uncharacterized protein PODANS_7_2760 [Podospora anserina S mat+]|uniref:Podospora anserina S mat+ genomic DNA chromosome 7, supercontig 1 n=2 Tax=Podospora TaxID=5144 RepID=B2AVJ2_PODAN|nr:uncharacterized protein PODANS_7_2760 [Podospora anserina S mat+]CAP68416.1 unnamed protein product [Podospora anserina S mat+]CDP31888.1 Putative protein of unknown function [Podospora anserina S mat+]VBB86372.1 Putative protein of unknown function [Podospora comata]
MHRQSLWMYLGSDGGFKSLFGILLHTLLQPISVRFTNDMISIIYNCHA